MIPVSERHCPEFGRDTSYLPKAWLNRKNLCVFFLKKPGQVSLFLPGLKQHTAQLPLWLSPLLHRLAGLLGKATPLRGSPTASCIQPSFILHTCQVWMHPRQAGIQFARPGFHPPLVPTAHCSHNPLDSFRGSHLSATLPLFFKALSWHLRQGHVLAGSTTLASACLWEAELRETWPRR